ncbi:MAG: hypothetical protein M3Q19_10035 [Pseudomonadota bacterium]|nr:hypothetical protein [Pseudomonadota bacterium]
MKSDLPAAEYIPILLAYLIVPLLLARVLVRANWLQTGAAFGILWAVLLFLGIAMGSTWGERIGWPMIFAMFFSTPGVPTIAWILKKAGALAG